MRRKSNVYKRVEDMSEDKEGLRGSGGLRQRVGASAEKEPLLPSRGDSSQASERERVRAVEYGVFTYQPPYGGSRLSLSLFANNCMLCYRIRFWKR